MRQILIAAIASITTVTAASAADPQGAFNWTGFYAGVHAGGAWTDQDMSFTDPNGVIGQTTIGNRDSGPVGGVHAGYNMQFAPALIAGVEADFTASELTAKSSVSSLRFSGSTIPNANLESQVDSRWLGSIRARLGFTGWRDTMFYVTGGAAWADIKFIGTEHNEPPTFATHFRSTASTSDIRSGYVLGGGAEVPLSDRLTFKAEYLYYSFDGVTDRANLKPNPGAFPTAFTYRWSDVNLNVVQLGLSYKF